MVPNLENVRKKSWSPIVANFKYKNRHGDINLKRRKKIQKQKKHQVIKNKPKKTTRKIVYYLRSCFK
jgi:hypothetical protein